MWTCCQSHLTRVRAVESAIYIIQLFLLCLLHAGDVSWITAPISVLFIIVIAGVISACITWYVCKQRKCRRTNKPKSIESAPDYTNQQQQLPPSSSQPPAASPVSYHDVSQQVTGVSKNGRVRQHEYVPSFSRHSDDKNMTDVGDSSVLDMTTSTYLHPLSCSFEDREDIRYNY